MTWTVGDTRTLYTCPWFRLDLSDVTLPDGQLISHHVIRVPAPSVGTLLVDGDRSLLLYRYRFITDRWGWEIPAGAAEPGEEPAAAALRELEEETGIRCSKAEKLAQFATSNGLIDQEFHIFRATEPTSACNIVSPEESTEIRWMTRTEQKEMLAAGDIHDGPTMIALLLNH